MIVDDEVAPVVGLAQRTCDRENVAALVLRDRLLLLLLQTWLAAAVKALEQLGTIVHC